MIGAYHALRDDLLSRGWIEHDWEPKADNDYFMSVAWDFLYTIKSRDAFRVVFAPFQYVNHIQNARIITTKVGLTHSLKNLVWSEKVDIGEFFPQSFDLTDKRGEEWRDFLEDFKFSQVVAYLKQASYAAVNWVTKNAEKIYIAIGICERRVYLLSGELFEDAAKANIFPESEFDSVSDDLYEYFHED